METDTLDEALTDQDRVLLVFGYLGPLSLVSLLATRREFVKWHAKQGLALFAVTIALYLVLRAIGSFVERYLWVALADLYRLGVAMVVLGIVVAGLFGLVRALEGERLKLPVVGDLADRL